MKNLILVLAALLAMVVPAAATAQDVAFGGVSAAPSVAGEEEVAAAALQDLCGGFRGVARVVCGIAFAAAQPEMLSLVMEWITPEAADVDARMERIETRLDDIGDSQREILSTLLRQQRQLMDLHPPE